MPHTAKTAATLKEEVSKLKRMNRNLRYRNQVLVQKLQQLQGIKPKPLRGQAPRNAALVRAQLHPRIRTVSAEILKRAHHRLAVARSSVRADVKGFLEGRFVNVNLMHDALICYLRLESPDVLKNIVEGVHESLDTTEARKGSALTMIQQGIMDEYSTILGKRDHGLVSKVHIGLTDIKYTQLVNLQFKQKNPETGRQEQLMVNEFVKGPHTDNLREVGVKRACIVAEYEVMTTTDGKGASVPIDVAFAKKFDHSVSVGVIKDDGTGVTACINGDAKGVGGGKGYQDTEMDMGFFQRNSDRHSEPIMPELSVLSIIQGNDHRENVLNRNRTFHNKMRDLLVFDIDKQKLPYKFNVGADMHPVPAWFEAIGDKPWLCTCIGKTGPAATAFCEKCYMLNGVPIRGCLGAATGRGVHSNQPVTVWHDDVGKFANDDDVVLEHVKGRVFEVGYVMMPNDDAAIAGLEYVPGIVENPFAIQGAPSSLGGDVYDGPSPILPEVVTIDCQAFTPCGLRRIALGAAPRRLSQTRAFWPPPLTGIALLSTNPVGRTPYNNAVMSHYFWHVEEGEVDDSGHVKPCIGATKMVDRNGMRLGESNDVYYYCGQGVVEVLEHPYGCPACDFMGFDMADLLTEHTRKYLRTTSEGTKETQWHYGHSLGEFPLFVPDGVHTDILHLAEDIYNLVWNAVGRVGISPLNAPLVMDELKRLQVHGGPVEAYSRTGDLDKAWTSRFLFDGANIVFGDDSEPLWNIVCPPGDEHGDVDAKSQFTRRDKVDTLRTAARGAIDALRFRRDDVVGSSLEENVGNQIVLNAMFRDAFEECVGSDAWTGYTHALEFIESDMRSRGGQGAINVWSSQLGERQHQVRGADYGRTNHREVGALCSASRTAQSKGKVEQVMEKQLCRQELPVEYMCYSQRKALGLVAECDTRHPHNKDELEPLPLRSHHKKQRVSL